MLTRHKMVDGNMIKQLKYINRTFEQLKYDIRTYEGCGKHEKALKI